jgi:hypothetical protein
VIPPPGLLTCAAEPEAPDTRSQREAALFVAELADAGQDCRDQLDRVRRFVEGVPK